MGAAARRGRAGRARRRVVAGAAEVLATRMRERAEARDAGAVATTAAAPAVPHVPSTRPSRPPRRPTSCSGCAEPCSEVLARPDHQVAEHRHQRHPALGEAVGDRDGRPGLDLADHQPGAGELGEAVGEDRVADPAQGPADLGEAGRGLDQAAQDHPVPALAEDAEGVAERGIAARDGVLVRGQRSHVVGHERRIGRTAGEPPGILLLIAWLLRFTRATSRSKETLVSLFRLDASIMPATLGQPRDRRHRRGALGRRAPR